MEEEFETIVRSQLQIIKNQMEVIKDYIDKYDEMSAKLKRTITNELITALISRFEKNEKLIRDMIEKIDSLEFKFQDSLSKSLREIREEISEAELNKAISKIFEEKEVKVSSRALEELRV